MSGGGLKIRAIGAAILAVVMGCQGVQAQPAATPPLTSLAVSDLIGLSPIAVRARLAQLPETWPVRPELTLQTSEGTLAFISLGSLLMDPALREELNRIDARSDPAPAPAMIVCQDYLTMGGQTSEAGLTTLVFRDNRLDAVLRYEDEPAMGPAPAVGGSPSAWRAFMKRPRSSPYIAHPGDLPLDDGPGFLNRWNKRPLSPGDTIGVACVHRAGQSLIKSDRGLAPPTAGDFQGLALLPFAPTLPFKNTRRVKARLAGAALLGQLKIGATLPPGFLDSDPGIRVNRAKVPPDYVVLSIDMGAYPSRNLGETDDVALVGVRGRRVEWIAPSANFPNGSTLGLSASLLCLDSQGVPGRIRNGCTDWGQFEP